MKNMMTYLCIALLIGCTSAPLPVHYYLLHTPENNISDTSDEVKPVAVLQLLDIADYLRQSSLVMQINEYEVYYSRQDVWAEKLQSSFYKALLQDLNATGQRHYASSSSPNAINASLSIRVQLAHFHVTDTSTVVSSGRYWLSSDEPQTDKNSQTVSSNHSFFFETPLQQDGYTHAVKQLRVLVNSLARQIEQDIAALPSGKNTTQ